MNIRAFAMLACALLAARSLMAERVPFEVCAESTTWTRPSPDVQAKIWNDNRYKDVAGTAYEWTHNFIVTDPESASIQYHSMNMSGLWTATPGSFKNCYSDNKTRRTGYEWIEVWVLLHDPAAQNRFRWKFYFSAENLKILPKKNFSSRKSKFPAEREMFSRKFKNSAEKLKVQLENKFFR